MDAEILMACPVCRTALEKEDLFCPNCGRESPGDARQSTGEFAQSNQLREYQFVCEGCGASMTYDPSLQALHCPYCGSTTLDRRPPTGIVRPAGVLPWTTDRRQVQELLRQHLLRNWFRPSNLLRDGTLVAIQPVYVPCWVFSAKTSTEWTADVADVPWWAKGHWRPVFAERQAEYSGILVPASQVLTQQEVDSLGPFDLNAAQNPDRQEKSSAFVEMFTIPRKYARASAVEKLRQLEQEACRRQCGALRHRNLKVNVIVSELSGQPYLLPVWVLAYRYRKRVYRFLVNGQTGVVAGRVPVSLWKILGIIGAFALFCLLVLTIVYLVG